MSANATFSEPWTGTLTQFEWPATPRLLLLALINVPVLSIVLNILWQLVSSNFLWNPSNLVQTMCQDTWSKIPASNGLALDTLPWLCSVVRS